MRIIIRFSKFLGFTVAVTMLSLTGCSALSESDEQTITLAEANAKVERYAESARRTIAPELTSRVQEKQPDAPCSNPDGSPAADRRDASVSYELENIPTGKIPAYFETLRTWWTTHGFTVTDEKPDNRFLRGENKTDGFSMALQSNPLGKAYLTVSSPCVWRNGTPAP